jgi:hypothetical protein
LLAAAMPADAQGKFDDEVHRHKRDDSFTEADEVADDGCAYEKQGNGVKFHSGMLPGRQ